MGYELRARRYIAEGEEVTIAYLSEEQLLATAPLRRAHLHSSKHFWCSCVRCSVGSADNCRGFCCPARHHGGNACSAGTVFCRVPPVTWEDVEPSSEDSVALLADAMCSECGRRFKREEGAALLAEEVWLEELLLSWDEGCRERRENMTIEEAKNVEMRICQNFEQHALLQLVWGHLTAYYYLKKDFTKADSLSARRAKYQKAALPVCAASAWTLADCAERQLRRCGLRLDSLLERPIQTAKMGILLNDDVCQFLNEQTLPLLREACGDLRLLFGDKHSHYRDVADWAVGLCLALEQVAGTSAAVAQAGAVRKELESGD